MISRLRMLNLIRRRSDCLLHRGRNFNCDSLSSSLDIDSHEVRKIFKIHENDPPEDIERSLEQSRLSITEELVFNVLGCHRSDWRSAYAFFRWVSSNKDGDTYSPSSIVYNEILDILGRMKRFKELHQVFDEMSKRGLITEKAYGIVLNRYAAAHMVEEATQTFYRRKQFGLKLDLISFQTLLISLCRYKHVDAAEFLFNSKVNEFKPEIKTMNIILNGWCIMGSLREAKRYWNEIITSKQCKPDVFTYAIFINSLTKAGKLSSAVKLFQSMFEKGCNPDVTICNCIIDALCFKKRIPEALDIFNQMNDPDCLPNVATYNSLIKHLCKIRRMEKVFELLDEMEEKRGDCLPNARTYGYLLSSSKDVEEVVGILERMKRVGVKMTSDIYNMVLRLFMEWNCEERVRLTWNQMEMDGVGHDQRSYTVMIHGLFEKKKIEEALEYYKEMVSKGMVAEPRTKILVKAININLQDKITYDNPGSSNG